MSAPRGIRDSWGSPLVDVFGTIGRERGAGCWCLPTSRMWCCTGLHQFLAPLHRESQKELEMPLLPAEPFLNPVHLFADRPVAEDALWWVLHTRPRAEKSIGRA